MKKRGWRWWLVWGGGACLLLLLSLFGFLLVRIQRDMRHFPLLVTDAKVGERILFQGVDVYPGWGKALLRGQDVLVDKGKIRKMGTTKSFSYTGAHVIQGAGHTLLPGLVDAHVHLSGSGSAPWRFVFWREEHNLHAYLRAGVTTVFDLGGAASASLAMREKVRQGKWLGPRIFLTDGPITSPGSHPIPAGSQLLPWPLGKLAPLLVSTIKKTEDAEKIIEGLKKKNVDYVKLILDQLPPGSPEMKDALVTALVRAAKAQKMRMFVHIGSARNALVAARAGADVLAHGIYRDELTEAQAKELAKLGVAVIPTLAGFELTAEMSKGTLKFNALERSMHPPILWKEVEGEKGKRFLKTPAVGEFAQGLFQSQKYWYENIRRLHRAGVRLLVGTDSALPAVYPGSSYHRELWALSRAGIPHDVLLTAATSGAASLLEKAPRYGKVAVGMDADLIMIKGDPLRDIRHVARLKVVMRAGKVLHFLQAYAKKSQVF